VNTMQAPGSSVNVSIQSILNELHKRYGQQSAALMQEVSELQCAVDAQSAELGELREKVRALSGGFDAPAPGASIYENLLGRPNLVEEPTPTDEASGPVPIIDMGARRT